MRPDEKTAQTMQNREHEWNKTIKKTGSNALKLGASLIGGGIAARILPFLSEFISPEIALKGITKVNPKIGDFLNRGMNQGLSLTEGLKYLKRQLSGEGEYAGGQEEEIEQPQQAQAPQQMNQEPPVGSLKALLKGQPPIKQQAQGQPAQQSQGDAAIVAALEKLLRM
jgi:hypothetical protein